MRAEFAPYDEKMSKTLLSLEGDFASIRAGRASAAVLDRIMVDYWGVPTPVNQMASVTVPEARTLVISPYDKSSLKGIEKAILASDLGINPSNDGSVIRLVFPALTEERRKEICKQVAKLSEEAKVAIRSIRRTALDKFKVMKKNAEITEDDLKNFEKEMQDLTDNYCKKIDKVSEAKEKEILSI